MAPTALALGTLVAGLATRRDARHHSAVGADRGTRPRGRWPHLLQLVGAGDHRREHHRQSDRRLHPGEHGPAARAHPGGSDGYDPTQSGVARPARRELERSSPRAVRTCPARHRGRWAPRRLPVYTGQSYSLVPADRNLAQHRHLDDRRLRRHLRAAAPYLPAGEAVRRPRTTSADISVNSSTGAWSLVYAAAGGDDHDAQ